MRKLCRCHFIYLLNRTTLLIFFLILFLSFLGFLDSAISLDRKEMAFLNNNYYYQNSFFILNLLGIFTSVFIYSHSFLLKCDQYSELILIRKISRSRYFLSKTLVISLFLIYFLILETSLFLVCGYFFLPKFFPPRDCLLAFFNLLFLSIYYGLLGLIFFQIFSNLYVIIIPFFLFIFGSIINESSNKFGVIFNFLFPNYLSDKSGLVFGSFHIMIVTIVLVLINQLIFLSRDL